MERARKSGASPAALFLVALGLLLAGCTSIPGETLAPRGQQREIRERVFAQARSAAPECRQQKIVNTEILEVHPDGKPADERWTVDQCGRRLDYVVSYPATGRGSTVQVRPER